MTRRYSFEKKTAAAGNPFPACITQNYFHNAVLPPPPLLPLLLLPSSTTTLSPTDRVAEADGTSTMRPSALL